MSTHWHVRCVSCGVEDRLDQATREKAREIIEAARTGLLRQVWHAVKNMEAYGIEVTVKQGSWQLDLDWYGTHDGGSCHKLVAVNDYGGVDGLCTNFVYCAGCGERHRCSLPDGHLPPCGLLRDDGSSEVIPAREQPPVWGIK